MLPGLREAAEHTGATSAAGPSAGSASAGGLTLQNLSVHQLQTISEQQTPSSPSGTPFSHHGPFAPVPPDSQLALLSSPPSALSTSTSGTAATGATGSSLGAQRKTGATAIGTGPSRRAATPADLQLGARQGRGSLSDKEKDRDGSAAALFPEIESPTVRDELVIF